MSRWHSCHNRVLITRILMAAQCRRSIIIDIDAFVSRTRTMIFDMLLAQRLARLLAARSEAPILLSLQTHIPRCSLSTTLSLPSPSRYQAHVLFI